MLCLKVNDKNSSKFLWVQKYTQDAKECLLQITLWNKNSSLQ